MRSRLLAVYTPLVGIWQLAAQDPGTHFTPGAACMELHQKLLDKVAIGQLSDAEEALSRALASNEGGHEPSCLWMTLHNMAHVIGLSGRLAEAEVLEQRSLRIMDRLFSPDDPLRLRPLHLLWSVQVQQEERGKARQTFRAMRSLRLDKPEHQAVFHGAAAAQLQVEGHRKEAEAEYSRALAAWRDLGRGESTDVAALLVELVYCNGAKAGTWRPAGRWSRL